MQFANYPDFRTKVQMLFDGDDISQSDLSTVVLDLIIAAGEMRLYRELRASVQDVAFSVTIASNAAVLPADFIEMKGAVYVMGAGKVVATYAPWEALTNQLQIGTLQTTAPVRYNFEGDSMIFYPTQPDGTVVTGRYYKRFPDIATGLNALFTRHADVFMYAALAESAPFLGELQRLPIWQAKYAELIESANESERRRVTRGSKLATKVA